jgi:hypothetical protein
MTMTIIYTYRHHIALIHTLFLKLYITFNYKETILHNIIIYIGGGVSFVWEYFYRYTPNIREGKKGPFQTSITKF